MVSGPEEGMGKKVQAAAPVAGSKQTIVDRYGSSLTVVDRLIDSGKLPAYKVGRRTFIKFSDADAVFFANRR